MGCINLQRVEIPGSVEELGGGLFAQCNVSNLTFSGESARFCVIYSFIVQKAGMKIICTFRNQSEIEIPAIIEEIGAQCFLNCSLLSKVTFSNEGNLKRIGKEAFSGCPNLLEIKIPSSVEEIGEEFGSFVPQCNVKCAAGILPGYTIHTTCTFMKTRRTAADQVLYRCITCGMRDGEACCQACYDHCHSGHEVEFIGKTSGFCDCYTGNWTTPCLFTNRPYQ